MRAWRLMTIRKGDGALRKWKIKDFPGIIVYLLYLYLNGADDCVKLNQTQNIRIFWKRYSKYLKICL